MHLAPKRRLAIGVSVLAVALVGAGASSACDGGGTRTAQVQAAQFTAFHTEHHFGWWRMAFVQATAGYLGLTPQQLVADLKAGQTLAQIAPAGKTSAGLADAWLAALRTKLDAAVAAGKLTSAQENDVLAKWAPKLSAWASAVWTKSWTGDRESDHFSGLWHR